jgi:hypothetical protein
MKMYESVLPATGVQRHSHVAGTALQPHAGPAAVAVAIVLAVALAAVAAAVAGVLVTLLRPLNSTSTACPPWQDRAQAKQILVIPQGKHLYTTSAPTPRRAALRLLLLPLSNGSGGGGGGVVAKHHRIVLSPLSPVGMIMHTMYLSITHQYDESVHSCSTTVTQGANNDCELAACLIAVQHAENRRAIPTLIRSRCYTAYHGNEHPYTYMRT